MRCRFPFTQFHTCLPTNIPSTSTILLTFSAYVYRRQSISGGDSTQPIKVTQEEILAQFSASLKKKMTGKPADTLTCHLADYTNATVGNFEYLQHHNGIEEQLQSDTNSDTFSLGTF